VVKIPLYFFFLKKGKGRRKKELGKGRKGGRKKTREYKRKGKKRNEGGKREMKGEKERHTSIYVAILTSNQTEISQCLANGI